MLGLLAATFAKQNGDIAKAHTNILLEYERNWTVVHKSVRKVHIFRYSDSLYSFQMFHTDTCIKINHNIAGRYFHKTCRQLLIFALYNFKTSNDMIVIISSFISINQ